MSLAINSILNEDVPPRLPEATCNQDAQQKQFKRPHLGTPNLGFDDWPIILVIFHSQVC